MVIGSIAVGMWSVWIEHHDMEYMVEKNNLLNGNWEGDEERKWGTEELRGSDERKYTLQSQDPNCKNSGRLF